MAQEIRGPIEDGNPIHVYAWRIVGPDADAISKRLFDSIEMRLQGQEVDVAHWRVLHWDMNGDYVIIVFGGDAKDDVLEENAFIRPIGLPEEIVVWCATRRLAALDVMEDHGLHQITHTDLGRGV